MRFVWLIILAFAGLAFVNFVPEHAHSEDHLTRVVLPENTKDSTLLWSADRRLVWKDFTGKPERSSTFSATTSSVIGFESQWYQDSAILSIPVYFNHNSSWVKNGAGSDKLLAHEQGHFDIAEIIGRMIRRDLSAQYFSEVSLTSKKVNAIYTKHVQQTWAKYERYDIETKHGTVEAKQQIWLKKIANELDALREYSSHKVILRSKTN